MPLPTRTKSTALTLTFYNIGAIIALLFFEYMYRLPQKASSSDTLLTLGKLAEATPFGALGLLLIWLFFAGLVILAVYLFFISHEPLLSKPKQLFSTFYFIFSAWVAIVLSFELTTLIVTHLLEVSLPTKAAIAVSLLLTVIVNAAGLFLMYFYLHGKLNFSKWLRELVLPKRTYSLPALLLWGVLAYFAFFPIFGIVASINKALLALSGKDLPIQPIIELSLANRDIVVGIALFIAVTVFAPIFEELIMRGLIFRGLLLVTRPKFAMALSGFVFSMFHFNLLSFFPLTVIGILLSWLYFRTGSLIPSIIAHSLFNGLNFVLLEVLK